MNITVDGIIYQTQSQGGISHLYDEILPRMCEKDETLYINLLTSGRCKKSLPVHPRIDHHSLFPIDDILRPTSFWGTTRFNIRAYLQYLSHKDSLGRIWHSTGFTIPHNWKGPVVLTVYDMLYERFGEEIFNKPIYDDVRKHKRGCITRADIIISISEATQRDLERYALVDSTKVKVIHLASSPVFRRIRDSDILLAPRTCKPFLLYVGARHAYKNFVNLLTAYSSWGRRKEVDLVVVGKAWTQQERDVIENLRLNGRVLLRTDVNDERLCTLYNQAIAFVFPSLYEGFGIPLLEAMACGCPIVASEIPTTVEVAGDVPVYFDPIETDSLLSALDSVISEGRASGRVGRGMKRAGEFSWDLTANETLNIYHELMTSGSI